MSGFVAHLITNHAFNLDFTRGETALGLGVFATSTLIFLWANFTAALSPTAILWGITTLGAVAVGFVACLVTRFGARGAFQKFDKASRASGHAFCS